MTAPPHFRLLLHGQDGSIPYLTPELMRLMFCPPSGGEKDTTSTNDDDGDLQQSWKWHREYLILGVAVKDTCVTAVYRDIKSDSSDKKKRKSEQQNGGSVGDNRSAKKVKSEQSKVDDAPCSNTQKSHTTQTTTETTNTSKTNNSSTSAKQQPSKSNDMNTKKPAGYTFLTPSQSAQICKEINSHINTDSTSSSANYMQTYLRIPQYISTLITPTFALDSPDNNKSTSGVKSSTVQDLNKNKHIPKQSSDNSQSKQKQQQKKKAKDATIPNSTKDSMPVDTPHGWQKIKSEQYVDAVSSLTSNPVPSSTTTASDIETANSLCEGAVGLFDHINTSRDQANCLFAQFMKDKSVGDYDKAVLTPQAQKSIEGMFVKGKWETMVQKLVQRTNDWSIRIANYKVNQSSTTQTMLFWLPIHMAASHLPLKYLFSCPRSNPSQEESQSVLSKLSDHIHIAITGWGSISYNREYRRQALCKLMTTLQQTNPTSTTQSRRKEYLILAVNDIQSILDAAREGVSIIGTDMVRLWSRDGMALCLDMSLDNIEEKKKDDRDITSGMIDLSDEKYARVSSALLPGCQCVACRPRQINTRSSHHHNIKSTDNQIKKTVPSFTRAYIHHLIKANEMLAETLLFVHNLHQMLLLFRQLSKAASLDDEESGDSEKRNLEAFCQKIEEQL